LFQVGIKMLNKALEAGALATCERIESAANKRLLFIRRYSLSKNAVVYLYLKQRQIGV